MLNATVLLIVGVLLTASKPHCHSATSCLPTHRHFLRALAMPRLSIYAVVVVILVVIIIIIVVVVVVETDVNTTPPMLGIGALALCHVLLLLHSEEARSDADIIHVD